ncbi:MAG: lipoyl(octanoyl) transferase LipB [Tepidiformaceae bacterium]
MAPPLHILHLGHSPYVATLDLQRRLQAERRDAAIPDTLLLTQHEPVLTLGRARADADLRVAPAVLDRLGISIIPTERGGDITYHGPGQLVAYAILDLKALGIGVVDHVTRLEETMIRTIARFGVEGARRPGARGVWIEDRKVASVGVNARHWVTIHGIALNVAPDMTHFDLINPCGLDRVVMTSLAREAASDVTVEHVRPVFVESFLAVFGHEPAPTPPFDGALPSSELPLLPPALSPA